ncbi:hypothetical protein BV22DRAFT_1091966 [Leucogyrophana mollusca]|uniref:Uncharacterized protein n=1 Tax=Leucogyrophana mollusca TaxID=85980 RepID=A0ACB8BDK8_9AGAM|nr:hypothetical protein BV22DRAFT_1091966 [Leucogyrophana mollusca]
MTSQMASTPSGTVTPKRPAKMASSQSLNHLLNFTLPPRQTQPMSLPRRSRKTGSQPVWNKERFVNAQYRFVMNPTGDYTVHFADPDIFFQWQDILQVLIPRLSAFASAASGGEHLSQEEGMTTCPICLSPPTAPRMTKCGHVFCFPCILHYLTTSNNLKWARCPICFDSVNEKQLKSVKWYDGPSYPDLDQEPPVSERSSSSTTAFDSGQDSVPRAGALMRMRLMQRPQITTLALPRSRTWPSDLVPPHQAPFYFLPDVYHYAKFMLATPDYMIADLSKDLDDLALERRMMVSMRDELSISFIDTAEQKVQQQIAKAAALESPLLKEAIDKAHRDQGDIERRFSLMDGRKKDEETPVSPLSDVPDAFLATQRNAGFTPHSIPAKPKPTYTAPPATPQANLISTRNQRQRRNVNPPPPSTQTYYYYQVASGLPIFLHPLDIKILFSHYNSYASFPDTITIRIDSAAEGTVNDDLRKRCKYLAHMPEGADVVFIEADLGDVVGQEGLKNFEGALKLRKARRKEKGKKDDRARARAEEREREKVVAPWYNNAGPVTIVDTTTPSVEVDEIPDPPPPAPTGAWGSRSFASALHSTPTTRRPASAHRLTPEVEDEWDMDAAWHELEQRGTGGNSRKKRNNRLVVLGGGAGGRRR